MSQERLFHDVDTPVKPVILNFLQYADKTFDWRYQTYNRMRSRSVEDRGFADMAGLNSRTIFWIGIFDLKRERRALGTIHFYDPYHGEMMRADGCTGRTPDGALKNGSPTEIYQYNFSKDMDDWIFSENGGNRFLQVMLMERVDHTGLHTVSLLHKKAAEKHKYGIFTGEPWFNDGPPRRWLFLVDYEFHPQDMTELVILSHKPYQWIK